MSSSRLVAGLLAVAVVGGCNGSAGASRLSAGVADARLADWELSIPGTCDFAGDDMTFTAPGDPLLSVGFNSTGSPTAVGNFSSVSKGIVSIIGHPDVEKPIVTISARTYSVSGPFFVGTDLVVYGEISITCD